MSTQNDLLGQALKPMITEIIGEHINALGIEEKINEAINGIAQNTTKLISVSYNGSEPIDIGVVHKQFELINKIVASGANLMLSGQAGN